MPAPEPQELARTPALASPPRSLNEQVLDRFLELVRESEKVSPQVAEALVDLVRSGVPLNRQQIFEAVAEAVTLDARRSTEELPNERSVEPSR